MELKLDSLLVTLGTDIKQEFAWCLRKINDVDYVCLHKRNDGFSGFNQEDFITAIPLSNILDVAKMRGINY